MDAYAAIAPLTLYVVRHPQSPDGNKLGDVLHGHFGPSRHQLTTGGVPIRVLFSNAVVPGSAQFTPIAWGDSATTAVAILIDDVFANDPIWLQHAIRIAQQASDRHFRTVAIPVALSPDAPITKFPTQALRWDQWDEEPEVKTQRLIREITYQLVRMLRHQTSEHSRDATSNAALGAYQEKVRVFLSHTKQDEHGARITKSIRSWLNDEASLATFLDVHDIPAGVSFAPAIEYNIGQSVMAIIYSDSYSSRDWCQREVLHAKRLQVPILVIDCLRDADTRAFPYLGNTPSLRMDPDAMDRMEHIASKLLDEVFKSLLWKIHVERLSNNRLNVTFMPRAPELVSLVTHPELSCADEWHIVYPEPPLGEQEIRLIASLGKQIRLHSLNQWLAEGPS